jgi:hypothetical protein
MQLKSIRDAAMKLMLALPASTSAVTTAAAMDLGKTSKLGSHTGDMELLITAPALLTAQLPDAKTMTYKVIMSDTPDLANPVDMYGNLLVQVGASGAGAAAATKRLTPPSDCKQYIGLVATPSASGTGDASGATALLEALF